MQIKKEIISYSKNKSNKQINSFKVFKIMLKIFKLNKMIIKKNFNKNFKNLSKMNYSNCRTS